jgi:hypothetical protein
MHKTLGARDRIYDHTSSPSCKWQDFCSQEESERYGIAKDTIQDTAEALYTHRRTGFIRDKHLRYLEYCGILQAIYMQQDAICALNRLFLPSMKIDWDVFPHWKALRELRNDTVGHPVGNLKRLDRNCIAYGQAFYFWCPKEVPSSWRSSAPSLQKLLDGYDAEAACVLNNLADQLHLECESKHRA